MIDLKARIFAGFFFALISDFSATIKFPSNIILLTFLRY